MLNKIATMCAALLLASCLAGPETQETEQGLRMPGDEEPPICGLDEPCDNPACEDLAYGCTLYAPYPDDTGCHVQGWTDDGKIQCLCTGIVYEDTPCVLSSFSS